MLTHEKIETLLEIQRNPKNINIDSKVPGMIIRFLIKNEYIIKSKAFRSTDGNIMFDYIVTDKGLEEMNNFEM